MALYHFRVKTDKRPGDKKTVKAIKHIEYINREGEFENIDDKKKPKLRERNLITSANKKDAFDGIRAALYVSSYGNIVNVEDGILIENDPSDDTLAIALMVAQQTLKGPLIIKGSERFKQKCVKAAAIAELPIEFQDLNLQTKFLHLKERQDNARKNFNGKIVRRKLNGFPKPHSIDVSATILKAPTIETLPSLRELSQRYLVPDGHGESGVLVPGHEYDELADERSPSAPPVRWNISGERRRRAEKIAGQILNNINLSVAAERHVEYINREKVFEKRGGCVYTSNRLPAWAKGSPNKFFKASDQYSPKNIDRYREIEFALQNELTLEQNIEIVEDFLKNNLPDHYYAYAIHDKIGFLSDEDTHNIHVHIMLSPRIIDDVELKGERKISKYFAYPWRTTAKDQSEEKRRNAGAPVDRRFNDRNFVRELRIAYQDSTNKILAKYGKQARIDHRSLKAQRLEAMANGDVFLAQLLDRIPEKHLAKYGQLDLESPEVLKLKKFRKKKNEYQDLLFQYVSLSREKEEIDAQEQATALEKTVQKILESNEFIDSQEEDDDSYISELRSDFLAALKAYNDIKDSYEPKDSLLEKAKIEYMTEDEANNFYLLKYTEDEIEHWLDFADYLHGYHLVSDDPEEVKAYEALFSALIEKLDALETKKMKLAEQAAETEKRLEASDVKKQIQIIVNRNMRENRHLWLKIKNAEQNLSVAAKSLEQALFGHMSESELKIYHIRELYQTMNRRFYGYKKEIERLKKSVDIAKKKIISLERAKLMAESVYSKGEVKKLREEDRKLKKAEAAIEKNLAADPTNKELLAQKEIILNKRATLTARQDGLKKRLSTPEAQDAIQKIALKIMDKHSADTIHYEKLVRQYKEAIAKFNETQLALPALKEALKKDPKAIYRVEPSELKKEKKLPPELMKNDRPDEPGIIAQAIARSGNCGKFVAQNSLRDDDQGLKNWALMSEIERREEEEKRLYKGI